uniref:RNF19A n=2 Tax=Macrostomum lignano TaxID=282301 RepID=A0A1I8IV11_9PLAT
ISPETARRLRPGDRSRSAGDVIASGGSAIGGGSLHQAAPGAVATSSTGAASPATALSGRGGRRRKSSPRTAVKETFRKMFLSRRKVSDSRLDSSWGDL